MYITEHAIARGMERFGVGQNRMLDMLQTAPSGFWIIDRKKSYDRSVDIGPKKVVATKAPNGKMAYFVVDLQNRVATVLTEAQAMHNFKVGKWTRS